VWILGCEIEHFLHDTRNGLSMAIGNGKQTEIIALTQERIGSRHVTARNHGPASNGQKVNNHECDEENRQ
jgi:hypothetical protein